MKIWGQDLKKKLKYFYFILRVWWDSKKQMEFYKVINPLLYSENPSVPSVFIYSFLSLNIFSWAFEWKGALRGCWSRNCYRRKCHTAAQCSSTIDTAGSRAYCIIHAVLKNFVKVLHEDLVRVIDCFRISRIRRASKNNCRVRSGVC